MAMENASLLATQYRNGVNFTGGSVGIFFLNCSFIRMIYRFENQQSTAKTNF